MSSMFFIQLLSLKDQKIIGKSNQNLVGFHHTNLFMLNFRNYSIIILIMQLNPKVPKVRKDINKLSPNEFSQFHILLRLLHIFEADVNDGGQYYYNYRRNQGGYTKPKCMYDSLISMHARCCEHSTQFFIYWHRWFTLKFEQYLQKADQKLEGLNEEKMKVQVKRLAQIAKSSSHTSEEQIFKQLSNLRTEYVRLVSELKKQGINYIAAHYWNLFSINEELDYPKGYRDGHQAEKYPGILLADKLIKLVWNQDGIYEINFFTRYGINPGFVYQPPDQELQNIIAEFKNLVEDKEFWKNPNKKSDKFEFYQKILFDTTPFRMADFFYFRQNQERGKKFQKQSILRFNVLSKDEINFILGGAGYRYYKKKQIKEEADIDVRMLKKARNLTIGYWNYGQSLKTSGPDFIGKFCTTGNGNVQYTMETPHNMLHNDQGYMMSDAAFSVTNPIFFAYHSFLDLLLEFKILEINKENTYFKPKFQQFDIIENKDENAGLATKKFFDSYFQGTGDSDDFKQNFKEEWIKDFKDKYGKYPKNQDYPIFKYFPTQISDYLKKNQQVSEYKYKDLVLSEKNGQPHLKNLNQLNKISYKVQNDFEAIMQELYNETLSPYSEDRQGIFVELTYKTNIPSQNFFLKVYEGGQLLSLKYIPIFTKGEGAKDCPNCSNKKILIVRCDSRKIRDYLRKKDKKEIKIEVTSKNVTAKIMANVQAIHILLNSNWQQRQEKTLTVCFRAQVYNKITKLFEKYETKCFLPFAEDLNTPIIYETVDYTIVGVKVSSKRGDFYYKVNAKVGQTAIEINPKGQEMTLQQRLLFDKGEQKIEERISLDKHFEKVQ